MTKNTKFDKTQKPISSADEFAVTAVKAALFYPQQTGAEDVEIIISTRKADAFIKAKDAFCDYLESLPITIAQGCRLADLLLAVLLAGERASFNLGVAFGAQLEQSMCAESAFKEIP